MFTEQFKYRCSIQLTLDVNYLLYTIISTGFTNNFEYHNQKDNNNSNYNRLESSEVQPSVTEYGSIVDGENSEEDDCQNITNNSRQIISENNKGAKKSYGTEVTAFRQNDSTGFRGDELKQTDTIGSSVNTVNNFIYNNNHTNNNNKMDRNSNKPSRLNKTTSEIIANINSINGKSTGSIDKLGHSNNKVKTHSAMAMFNSLLKNSVSPPRKIPGTTATTALANDHSRAVTK